MTSLDEYRHRIGRVKHQAILDAGKSVFSTAGFHAASIAEIARIADVSSATLYKHFASKERLFEELVSHLGPRFVLRVAAAEMGSISSSLKRSQAPNIDSGRAIQIAQDVILGITVIPREGTVNA